MTERARKFSCHGEHPALIVTFANAVQAVSAKTRAQSIVPAEDVIRELHTVGSEAILLAVRINFSSIIDGIRNRKKEQDIADGKMQIDVCLALNEAGLLSDEMTTAILTKKLDERCVSDAQCARIRTFLETSPHAVKNLSIQDSDIARALDTMNYRIA